MTAKNTSTAGTGRFVRPATLVRIATQRLVMVGLGACCCLAGPLASAMSAGELLELSRRTTFEVVLPKIEPEGIKYEKPLPLELLTYTERNDRYWSIGTAFAIAPDTFVSAAHVLLSGIGSPMGQPQLRDSAGKVYPVEQVLRFSLHQDYIVFRARGAAVPQGLQPNREPSPGATVYAVGNALGDGVVVRDGLLTSLTPEDQDGRWKWLRFSAAASPGNSGGPLLDGEGRVTGVITAKSPGENLNYALPIGLVLDDRGTAASIEVRSSFSLPILRQQLVDVFKDSFPLPASWDNFTRTLIERSHDYEEATQRKLLAQHAAELPPRGGVARLLATLETKADFGLIHQQADDSWDISQLSGEEATELPDGGKLWTGSLPGALGFRLRRRPLVTDVNVYHDDAAFMDTLLKGLKLPRVIGPQAIRITSLGPPEKRDRYQDRFGRNWQVRSWSLGYADMQLVTFALPTPEGYVGLVQFTTAADYRTLLSRMRLLADYTHASYRGSAAQWRTLLAERELCPQLLRGVKLGKDIGITVPLSGLEARLPASLLPLEERSSLVVHIRYGATENGLLAEVGGVTLAVDPDDDDSSWLGVWSQPRPADGAGTKLADRWRDMSGKRGKFTGDPNHNSNYSEFWTNSVVGDPAQNLLFEVVLSLQDKSLLPRQVAERRDQLLAGLQLRDGKD